MIFFFKTCLPICGLDCKGEILDKKLIKNGIYEKKCTKGRRSGFDFSNGSRIWSVSQM
jgi:hypothetical protein